MKSRKTVLRFGAMITAGVLSLAGCQSSSTTKDALSLNGQNIAISAPEILGSGETKIAMAIPFSGAKASESRAIRNGAELALDQLSDGKLTLVVLDANSQTLSQDIQNHSPKLLAYSGQPALSPDLSPDIVQIQIDADSFNGSTSSYAFQESDVGSLAAGLNFISLSTSDKVVVVVDPQFPAKKLNWLKNAVSKNTVYVQLDRNEAPSATIAKLRQIGAIGVIGFTDSDSSVTKISTELKKAAEGFTIVGHTGWSAGLMKNPILNGALIAVPDASSHGLIAGRYKDKFGTNPTIAALEGFDIIAISAGIVRSNGAEQFNRKTFEKASGFRGATGAFRFEADRSIRRLFEITVIKNGAKVKVQDAAVGF